MKLTMGQAAKETGVSKTTLSRAIRSGRLSANKQDNGSFEIDPSELFRVFPRNSTAQPLAKRSATLNVTPEERLVTPSITIEMVRLEVENEALKREVERLSSHVEDLKKDRDDWKQQAAVVKVITDMRSAGGFWSLFRRS